MKKTTYLLLLASILSTSLFSKNGYENNEIFTNFKYKPYLEVNQNNTLLFIEKEDYKTNYFLLNTIKDVYIYTDNVDIQNKIDILLNSEEKTEKINNTFQKNKENLKKEHNYILYSNKKNNNSDLLNELLSKKSDKLSLEEVIPVIDVLIKNGKNKIAQETFLNFINIIEKKKNISKTNNEEKNLLLSDLYSYGAYLNYNNKDLYNLYLNRALLFSNNKDLSRFHYIIYKCFDENELYSNSVFHLEEVSKIETEYSIHKKLLESYYKSSRKGLLNNNNSEAWLFAKKGIEMFYNFKFENKNEKTKYKTMLIELKKQLKLSSLKYQDELLKKGENNHSSKINGETLKLLGLNLI